MAVKTVCVCVFRKPVGGTAFLNACLVQVESRVFISSHCPSLKGAGDVSVAGTVLKHTSVSDHTHSDHTHSPGDRAHCSLAHHIRQQRRLIVNTASRRQRSSTEPTMPASYACLQHRSGVTKGEWGQLAPGLNRRGGAKQPH